MHFAGEIVPNLLVHCLPMGLQGQPSFSMNDWDFPNTPGERTTASELVKSPDEHNAAFVPGTETANFGGLGTQMRWRLADTQVLKVRHDFERYARHRDPTGKLIDQFR